MFIAVQLIRERERESSVFTFSNLFVFYSPYRALFIFLFLVIFITYFDTFFIY